jgi:hypothetical protein
MFDWAKYRRAKGALKLHLLLDHDGYLPQYVCVSEGKLHEINVLRRLSFDPGTIVVIDRGLVDYELFGLWTKNGIFFVTRFKKTLPTGSSRNVPCPNIARLLKIGKLN